VVVVVHHVSKFLDADAPDVKLAFDAGATKALLHQHTLVTTV